MSSLQKAFRTPWPGVPSSELVMGLISTYYSRLDMIERMHDDTPSEPVPKSSKAQNVAVAKLLMSWAPWPLLY